jgi:hypothetical protein
MQESNCKEMVVFYEIYEMDAKEIVVFYEIYEMDAIVVRRCNNIIIFV